MSEFQRPYLGRRFCEVELGFEVFSAARSLSFSLHVLLFLHLLDVTDGFETSCHHKYTFHVLSWASKKFNFASSKNLQNIFLYYIIRFKAFIVSVTVVSFYKTCQCEK